MPLSTFAWAAAGCTITPPSTATHTLCTRILPLARSSENLDRTGAERARALRDRDAKRASVRPLGLVAGHLRQRLEHLARLGGGAHALEAELDRIHALIDRHLVDEAFDRERVEHMADRAPVLELDAV